MQMPSFIVAKLLIRMRMRNEDAEKGVKGDVVVKNLLKAMSPGAMSRPAPLQENSHVSTPARNSHVEAKQIKNIWILAKTHKWAAEACSHALKRAATSGERGY